MTYKERISGTVSAITEHTACCWCKIWIVNGVERLQAYQGFFYDSKPSYSRISSCGDRIEISAEDFTNRLGAILNA